MKQTDRYPSAKSTGFSVLIWGVLLLLVVSAFLSPAGLRLTLSIAAALVAALLLSIWFGTWYEFRDDVLFLRSGPFFERIPYEHIVSATKLKSFASSFALSSDMIELRHGENWISGTTLVSPMDRDGFLGELKTRCPNLK